MIPTVIAGTCHADTRGKVFYNNNFNASKVKRIYVIENILLEFIRAWQGHKIEQRWFSVINGSFRIRLIKIDNWESPSKKLEPLTFLLDSEKMDVLHVPEGYVSSIQSLEPDSRLLIMSDYSLGEINDEFRYEVDYFKNND